MFCISSNCWYCREKEVTVPASFQFQPFFLQPPASISFPITCDFGALSNRLRTLSCLRFPSVSFRQPQKPVAGRIGYAHVFSPSILLLCHPLPLNSELFATLISSLLDAHEKRAELKSPSVDCEIRAIQAIRPPPIADASVPGKRRPPPSPVPREGGEDEIMGWRGARDIPFLSTEQSVTVQEPVRVIQLSLLNTISPKFIGVWYPTPPSAFLVTTIFCLSLVVCEHLLF